jgi:N-acetylglutamate synthase-like GNAT family acetyltransferase
VDIIEQRRRARADAEPFPITFVGFTEQTPVATATLKQREMATHEHLEHWIGNVYVPPEHRRRGFASDIVRVAVQHARELGIETLYLFAIDQVSFYETLGWRVMERAHYHGDNVVIMKRDIGSDAKT